MKRQFGSRKTKCDGIFIEFVNTDTDPRLASILIAGIEAVKLGENKIIQSVTIILTSDTELHRLNNEYLGIDEPTDVLAFNLSDDPYRIIEGDIYISVIRAAAQAAEHNEPTEIEIARLAIHGMLHLCGWEHTDELSLKSMLERGEAYLKEVKNRGLIGN